MFLLYFSLVTHPLHQCVWHFKIFGHFIEPNHAQDPECTHTDYSTILISAAAL